MKWLEASNKKSVSHLPLYHYHFQLQIDFPVERMELEGCNHTQLSNHGSEVSQNGGAHLQSQHLGRSLQIQG